MKLFKLMIPLLVVLPLLSFISFAHSPQWHMINVNKGSQGDAHLLTDGGEIVMIDAGEYEQAKTALVPYLNEKGISIIGHFFISHPHTDHYAGLDALFDAEIMVENIYYNLPPKGSDDFNYKRSEFLLMIERAKELGSVTFDISKGFTLKLPSSKIELLYADKGVELGGQATNINDYSLILRWDVGGFRVLFTGDLNRPLGKVLAMQKYYKADILKVPHHGVSGIAPDSFFNTVAPKLNMFPSSTLLWSHPRIEQSKSWTLNAGIYYCNNGLNGDVVLTFSNHIEVKSLTPTQSCPNGILNIEPDEKVVKSKSSFLPAIHYLIHN